VTVTTLGYGDFHPIGIGKIFASMEAISFMWAVYIAVLLITKFSTFIHHPYIH